MLKIILTERKKPCQVSEVVWTNSPIRDLFFIYLFIHLFTFEDKGLTAKQWKSIDPVILEFDWMLHFNQTNFSIIFKSVIISFTLGFGTTHKVNNLIIQGSFGEREFHGKVHSPKRKRSRQSFSPTFYAPAVNYRYRKHTGPVAVSFPENEASDFILDDSNKHHFLWILLRYKATNFRIPSWTGFQISISKGIPLLQTSIGYLNCIDSSATEMSTIYQVLSCVVPHLIPIWSQSYRLVGVVVSRLNLSNK